jgi:hypothetical protein
MALRAVHEPELPFRGRQGCCPQCGAALRPVAGEVQIGTWSGEDPATRLRTGGPMFSYRCAGCGCRLMTFQHNPRWEEIDCAQVVWYFQDFA